MCLLSHQIAGFFDHQYFWKESINIKILLCFGLCFRTAISSEVQKSFFLFINSKQEVWKNLKLVSISTKLVYSYVRCFSFCLNFVILSFFICLIISLHLSLNLLGAHLVNGALSGLRQFLAADSPLKMMKNAFYFTSKALFVLKIFKSWLFGHISKRLDWKDKVNFTFHDVTTWLTNNCNTHIAQNLEKQRQSDNEIWSVNRMYHEKHFSRKIIHKIWWIN